MKKTKTVKKWKDMKLLLSYGRKEILDQCIDTAYSIKELSILLTLNPSSVHNHVKKLRNAGFLKVEKTRVINGIVEKKYLATAMDFVLAPAIRDKRNEKMNEDMASYIHKEVLTILREGKLNKIKHHRVRLNSSNLKKAKSMMEELERFILDNHGADESLSSFILVNGTFMSDHNGK